MSEAREAQIRSAIHLEAPPELTLLDAYLALRDPNHRPTSSMATSVGSVTLDPLQHDIIESHKGAYAEGGKLYSPVQVAAIRFLHAAFARIVFIDTKRNGWGRIDPDSVTTGFGKGVPEQLDWDTYRHAPQERARYAVTFGYQTEYTHSAGRSPNPYLTAASGQVVRFVPCNTRYRTPHEGNSLLHIGATVVSKN